MPTAVNATQKQNTGATLDQLDPSQDLLPAVSLIQGYTGTLGLSTQGRGFVSPSERHATFLWELRITHSQISTTKACPGATTAKLKQGDDRVQNPVSDTRGARERKEQKVSAAGEPRDPTRRALNQEHAVKPKAFSTCLCKAKLASWDRK